MIAHHSDPYDLQRFLDAQETDYDTALSELKRGEKRSHWIWYVFPQMKGLGMSFNSEHYGISGLEEAWAYLEHPVLGRRLIECVRTLLSIEGKSAVQIMGSIDAVKLKSCLTLFDIISPYSMFSDALHKYYDGERDPLTLKLLGF